MAQMQNDSESENRGTARPWWLGFRFDRITNRLTLLALWIMIAVPALSGVATLAVKEGKDVVSCAALLIIAASLGVIGRPAPDQAPARVRTRVRRPDDGPGPRGP